MLFLGLSSRLSIGEDQVRHKKFSQRALGLWWHWLGCRRLVSA
ncbi:MAG: hypothetical protein ACI814_005105, partial [Mariniblastus sp.]